MEPTNSMFGSYRLLQLLGEGGMGRVWKAVDVRLERIVALKILKGEDEERRRALVAEAKTSCQLQHPNIAVVYEAGDVDGTPFIAMEYVEGRNLACELGRRMELQLLLNLAIQACKALHHAHLKGVVHRDIKPDNLVVDPEGTLKVLDFGVAKRNPLPTAGVTAQAFTLTRETEAGISVGTPSYMSPEQVFGLPQGAAADQFSLGTVLFELAAAKHPFRKTSLVETLHAIGKESHPNLAKLCPDLPRDLVKILDRMLDKDVAQRFPSLLEAQVALEALAFDLATGRMPATARSVWRPAPKTLAWGLGISVLLAGAGIGLFRTRGSNADTGSGLGLGRKVVAVLPVELEGIPSELAWTGHSFQDAMAMGLVRRGDLLVLDRTRVAEVLASVGMQSMKRLQKDLGAQYLVLSSLRGGGDRLRLTVRVVHGEAGEVVEQFQVQGENGAILDIEDELSRRLPSILGSQAGTPATGPVQRAKLARTRELYTKGADLVVQGNVQAFEMARQLFEEALRAEPDYAPAHAGLGWALLELGATGVHLGREESKALGERAILEGRKAVALDPGLAFAHRVLAEALHRRGDISGAHSEASRAVELDPADFRALVALGDAHAYMDSPEARTEARKYYLRALELRPTDWFAHYRLAVLLQNDGDLEEAIRHADEACALQPEAEYPHLTAAVALLWLGREQEALARILEGQKRNPEGKLLQLTKAMIAHRQGDRATFDPVYFRLQGSWAEGHPIRILLAGLHDDLAGNPEGARQRFLAYLEICRHQDWTLKTLSERRTTSVNLYHMAEVLGRKGDGAAARGLLDEAEKLHPGKRRVAQKDPLLKNL
jgi:serine/threonine-protein kinase